MSELAQLQQRFFKALLEPIYGISRAHTDLPAREGSVSEDFSHTANDLITPSKTLLPVERLELYHRQYWYRILDSIDEDFEVVKCLLGKEQYWGLLEAYLESNPSQDYTMLYLGKRLAKFINDNPAILGEKTPYVYDLVKVEYAMLISSSAKQLAIIDPNDIVTDVNYRFRLQPHIALHLCTTPAYEMLSKALVDKVEQIDMKELPTMATGERQHLITYRNVQTQRIHYRLLTPAAHSILQKIQQGNTLADSLSEVVWPKDFTEEQCQQEVQSYFGDWMQQQWLAKIS